jgi:endonuclease/exonuclease/phosphatase family metal-dependent hydrolase
MAQVDGLLRIHAEACGHGVKLRPVTQPGEAFDAAVRPCAAVMCGDFNFKPNSAEHARLTTPPEAGAIRFVDAWQALYPKQAHPPSVGVHEDLGGPFCCDFVFVTEDLAPRVKRVWSDARTQASVHQPFAMELGND